MKDLIEYIARSIVTEPDKVVVTEEENDEFGFLIKLDVAPEDKGRIIGKQGRVAQAMRTLLRVKAARSEVKVRLQIL
jgi:hypothetical protein